MKTALEAWGSNSNLFRQGAAKETSDPKIVAATMARPGVVLRRPVGSSGPFSEHAALRDLAGDVRDGAKRARPKSKKRPPGTDQKAARRAALEYERTERQRQIERRKEEAAKAKARQH